MFFVQNTGFIGIIEFAIIIIIDEMQRKKLNKKKKTNYNSFSVLRTAPNSITSKWNLRIFFFYATCVFIFTFSFHKQFPNLIMFLSSSALTLCRIIDTYIWINEKEKKKQKKIIMKCVFWRNIIIIIHWKFHHFNYDVDDNKMKKKKKMYISQAASNIRNWCYINVYLYICLYIYIYITTGVQFKFQCYTVLMFYSFAFRRIKQKCFYNFCKISAIR